MDRRSRDKNQTINEIITAARKLFSEKGLHGTSIRDIEKLSGVSKGLILHHFETKDNLYKAVQDYLTHEYTAQMAAQKPKSKDFKEMISSAVQQSFIHTKKNVEFRRLSLWSYLENMESNSEIEKQFTTNLISTMQAGQKAGIVRQDIDPFVMPFIIKGAIEYWIRKEELIKDLSSPNSDNATKEDRFVNALINIFIK